MPLQPNAAPRIQLAGFVRYTFEVVTPMQRMLRRTLPRMAVVVLLAGSAGCDVGCDNRIVGQIPSPDGRRRAVVFARECGTTKDARTHISVMPAAREPSGDGNVFVADTDHGRAPAGPGGGPQVRVRWFDRRTLEIRYDGRAHVVSRDARHDDTNVRFVAERM
jgi:hypothetical protein